MNVLDPLMQISAIKKVRKRLKSIGATFLNGEHYLVDALGNLVKIKETGDSSIFIANPRRKM